MVGVVPRLAEGQHREPDVVASVVAAGERARAVEVADRVDRPRDVVQQCHAQQAGPDGGGERPHQRHRPEAADDGGQDEGGGDQPREGAVDLDQTLVVQQVRRPGLGLGAVGLHHPAEMRVVEPAEDALDAIGGGQVGRVGVTELVGVGVVAPVRGHPVDAGTLHRERPGDGPPDANPVGHVEGLVRQQPVQPTVIPSPVIT